MIIRYAADGNNAIKWRRGVIFCFWVSCFVFGLELVSRLQGVVLEFSGGFEDSSEVMERTWSIVVERVPEIGELAPAAAMEGVWRFFKSIDSSCNKINERVEELKSGRKWYTKLLDCNEFYIVYFGFENKYCGRERGWVYVTGSLDEAERVYGELVDYMIWDMMLKVAKKPC